MTTLEVVPNSENLREMSEAEAARELVRMAREQGLSLTGPDGLLKQLTKTVIETALDEEMTEHLGYEKHNAVAKETANARNGTRSKTVLTETTGPVEIEVPRDRDGSFEPVIVRKRQRRLNGVDEVVLSLYAKGLTTGEISAHFAEIYGASVSKETISRITDKVLEEMAEWQNRPLDEVYAAIFIDAIMVKIRDGQVTNRPLYAAIGVTLDGEKEILGLWAGTGGEGAKFWMSVLTDIRNRGVKDTFFLVCDGLKGLPEVVGNVWPLTIVQTLSVHNGVDRTARSATCTVAVRTCADASPPRSPCRPVRPPRGRIVNQPAGVATSRGRLPR
jgi:putative transposase